MAEFPDQDETYEGYFDDGAATFGDRLAAAREAVGFKQSDLAARLGVMAKTVRNWEEDRSEPRANKLQMLSGVLNVSMQWLLNGDGDGVEFEAADADVNVQGIMMEIRELRRDSTRLTERIARLEKQLRSALG